MSIGIRPNTNNPKSQLGHTKGRHDKARAPAIIPVTVPAPVAASVEAFVVPEVVMLPVAQTSTVVIENAAPLLQNNEQVGCIDSFFVYSRYHLQKKN